MTYSKEAVLLWNDGNNNFLKDTLLLKNSSHMYQPKAYDIEGDEDMDLLLVGKISSFFSTNDYKLQVYKNQGDGKFSTHTSIR